MSTDFKSLVDEELSKAAGGAVGESEDYVNAVNAVNGYLNEEVCTIDGVKGILLNFTLTEEEKQLIIDAAKFALANRK